LQKLPLRRRATTNERVGLLPCWQLVPSASEIFTGRTEDKKGWWLAAPFGAQRSTRLIGGSANPEISAFCPSALPVKNLDRAKWPGFDPEASAIQAAAWQPEMCRILRSCISAANPDGTNTQPPSC
jgi:hypothetical protein